MKQSKKMRGVMLALSIVLGLFTLANVIVRGLDLITAPRDSAGYILPANRPTKTSGFLCWPLACAEGR